MAPNHSLSGRISVDLASRAAVGAIAVPRTVGDTLESPSVMLTQGALLGAAIGDRLGEGLRGLLGK